MSSAAVPRVHPLTAAADEYLRTCFAQRTPPHVGELARLAGLTLPQFSAAFLAESGERPSVYLKRAQLTRARELLETTSFPLDEVAGAAAFGTHVTFFRAFRKAYGSTPAEYRRGFQIMLVDDYVRHCLG